MRHLYTLAIATTFGFLPLASGNGAANAITANAALGSLDQAQSSGDVKKVWGYGYGYYRPHYHGYGYRRYYGGYYGYRRPYYGGYGYGCD